MRYEFRIGLAFMFQSKGQSIFLVSAIALSIAVQVFISSLVASVEVNIIDRVLGDTAHIYIDDGNVRDRLLFIEDAPVVYGNFPLNRNKVIEHRQVIEALKKYNDIINIVPTVEGNAIYKRQGKSTSLTIRGMDLNTGDRMYNIISRIIAGSPLVDSDNVLIGTRLAKDYDLKIGDGMDLTLPNGNIQRVRIAGIFDLENTISNTSLMIMDLNRAQRIFDQKGYITKINIQIRDVFKAGKIAEEIKKEFPDLEVVAWTRDGQALLNALESQVTSSTIIQIVIMLATSMSIASVLVVTVLQKTKEIGILKAMGALDRSTGLIFLVQGTLIGFFGAFLGIFFGIGMIHLYIILTHPDFDITISPNKLMIIMVISTISGTISAIFPAMKCMKLSPIEVIKGE